MPKTRLLFSLVAVVLAGLLLITSCFSQGPTNVFFDAGADNLSVSGAQIAQYVLYRFETSGAGRTITLPSAAEILAQISSPTLGQLFAIAVTAEGANPVTVLGGVGLVIKPSAAEVAGNSTKNLYFVVTNTGSGTQSITVY
jgi:hypothetical protein